MGKNRKEKKILSRMEKLLRKNSLAAGVNIGLGTVLYSAAVICAVSAFSMGSLIPVLGIVFFGYMGNTVIKKSKKHFKEVKFLKRKTERREKAKNYTKTNEFQNMRIEESDLEIINEIEKQKHVKEKKSWNAVNAGKNSENINTLER